MRSSSAEYRAVAPEREIGLSFAALTCDVSAPMGQMRWFVRGDIDGFFGLALDNLVQLLVIAALCRTVLGFPEALVYGRILPGAAVSLLVGQPVLRLAGDAARAVAPAATTCARCPTASTPSRSSPTCSW